MKWVRREMELDWISLQITKRFRNIHRDKNFCTQKNWLKFLSHPPFIFLSNYLIEYFFLIFLFFFLFEENLLLLILFIQLCYFPAVNDSKNDLDGLIKKNCFGMSIFILSQINIFVCFAHAWNWWLKIGIIVRISIFLDVYWHWEFYH